MKSKDYAKEISIIIPSYNTPKEHLENLYISLLKQSFKHFEVIIVDDCSDFNFYDIIIDKRFKIVNKEYNSGPAESRNIGIRESKGDILVFLDSDCVADKDWLKSLVFQHEAKGYSVVGGGVAAFGKHYMATCYNISTFHENLNTSPAGIRAYLPTINISIIRKVADDVGFLKENIKRAEDIEWTARMTKYGYKPFFDPTAFTFHIPETNLKRIWIKWVSSGYYSREVRQQYPDILSNPSFLKHRYLLLALSPFIALIVTSRIYFKNIKLLKYLHTFPVVYITKFAWCLGASYGSGAKWLKKYILLNSTFET